MTSATAPPVRPRIAKSFATQSAHSGQSRLRIGLDLGGSKSGTEGILLSPEATEMARNFASGQSGVLSGYSGSSTVAANFAP